MKKRIFFRNSGLFFFFIIMLVAVFIFCVIGVCILIKSLFFEKNDLLTYVSLFGGFLGIGLMGFELASMLRQTIIMQEKQIYVPEEWGMIDEKAQYKVFVSYNEINEIYLFETTNNSKNKPIKRYNMVTIPQLYIVFRCKNGGKKAISILFYSRNRRIAILNEIILRARSAGNDFTNKTGEEIYNNFIFAEKELMQKMKEKRKNKKNKKKLAKKESKTKVK